MKRVLFVCSQNRLRGPTAEQVFADIPSIEVASAGFAYDADNPLTMELVQWADVIFVMEQAQRRKLQQKFKPWLKQQSVICLGIADVYRYMEPALVQLLEKVMPYLR